MLHSILARAARRGLLAAAPLSLAFNPAAAAAGQEKNTVEHALAAIKHPAIPAFYSGKNSANLDHLRRWTAHTPPPENSPPATQSPEYGIALNRLSAICPSIPKNDRDFNAATWVNRHLAGVDLTTMPRQFLESVYFTVGRMSESRDKVAALTLLSKNLPDSPEFLEFLDRKSAELNRKLEDDPHLKIAAAAWPWSSPQYREQTLSYIMGQTLTTLLPGHHIAYPKLRYLTDGTLRNNEKVVDNAAYHANFNEIYVNGTVRDIRENFAAAKEIVIHETFHTFEYILAEWEALNAISDPALSRQAKFYLAHGYGAGVNPSDSYEGYRTSFVERGSWSFQLTARAPDSHGTIEQEMFTYRNGSQTKPIAPPPRYNPQPLAGNLPVACANPIA